MTATAAPRVITEREIGAAKLRRTLDRLDGRETPAWIREIAESRAAPSRPSVHGPIPGVDELERTRARLSADASPEVLAALQTIVDNAVERMKLTAAAGR